MMSSPKSGDPSVLERGHQKIEEENNMSTARSGTAISAAPDATSLNKADWLRPTSRITPGAAPLVETELESFGVARRLPLAQRSLTVGKVAVLEGRLFDRQGHPRSRLSDHAATTLLGQINDLRRQLGWLALDLDHHHIWPAPLAS